MKFPTMQEMAKDVAEKALDEYIYNGKTLRQWVNDIQKYQWIPCSERLPEESGTYVVNAIENGIIHVSFAKWMPRMKTWNLTGSRAYWKVNAWMPLPESYIYTESEDNKHD